MQVHAFDTHVMTTSGQHIHFDVLVNDENVKQLAQYAEQYLASLGFKVDNIKQSRCIFCHSEIANLDVQGHITNQGDSIIRL